MPLKRSWLPATLLVLLPCLAFGASLWNGFVDFDDPGLIMNNLKAQSLSRENIRLAFTTYDPELYIPLTLLSYQITGSLFGLSPLWFHLGNLLLHIGSVLLLWRIMRRLIDDEWIAILIAVLFAIHPLQTETIAWAAARKDVLSAFFALGSLLCWIRWYDERKRSFLIGSIALFVFALLSKVSILFFPLLWPLLMMARGRRLNRSTLLSIVPHLVGSAALFVVALLGKITTGPFLWAEILAGIRSIPFLLQRLIVPVHLSVLYPYTKNISLLNPDIFLSLIFILVVSFFVFQQRKKSLWPLVGWLWFLVMLAPSFGNVVKGQNELLDLYITSDRYAYLALIGPLMVIGLLYGWARDRWKTVSDGIAGIVIVILIILSVRQTLTWKDSESLWRHTIAVQPNSYLAHSNLGVIFAERGDREGAALEFGTALGIRPDAQTYRNLGVLLEEVGKPDLALRAYQKAVEASPLQKDAYVRIAVLLSKQGKFADALKALQEAKELDPSDVEIEKAIEWLNTGKALP